MNRLFLSTKRHEKAGRRGVALILVLGVLVLLVTLVVTFMTASRNDLTATAQYASGQEALALSETATNLVMSQIREATLAGIDSAGAGTHAWASQPGAIRVWDQDGQPAEPYLYKLYSAAKMKEDTMNFLSSEVPTDWRTQPDVYVDINEPVKRSGSWRYPVLNPAGLSGTASPATSGTLGVAGFSSTVPQESVAVGWDTRASMPVRWLYIGQNGELTNDVQADSVGRIAFWTDDETSKVNINTAGFTQVASTYTGALQSCSFWDVPATRLGQDYDMGRTGPHQDEFQRYPGHPASVNLGSILRIVGNFTATADANKFNLKNAFSLLPRYKWGGSENGTKNVTIAAERLDGEYRKQERLYSSVDELVFDKDRQDRIEPAYYPSITGFSKEQLTDYYRFFLTATSRAPDLNLFGGPKVGLWPVHVTDSENTRTVFDNLIARCNKLGSIASGIPFYFQRANALSQTDDWELISRNREIFSYLQRSTSTLVPGFGGRTFEQKYDGADGAKGERDQILAEIFDYIRCVNLNETYPVDVSTYQAFTPMLNLTKSLNDGGLTENQYGAGFVLPIKITTVKDGVTYGSRGLGRVPTLSEVGIMAVKNWALDDNGIATYLLMEASSPMMGYMPWITPQKFSISVKGSQRVLKIGGQDVTLSVPGIYQIEDPESETPKWTFQSIFPSIAGGATIQSSIENPWVSGKGQTVGGSVGHNFMAPRTGNVFSANHTVGGNSYPFYSPVQPSKQFPMETIQILGGKLEIAYGINGVPFQTFSVDIPDATIPTPKQYYVTGAGGRDSGRRAFNSGTPHGYRVKPDHDLLHSVVLRDGDVRVSACLENVPGSFFEKHRDYGKQQNMAHSFRFNVNRVFSGASFGGLISKPGESDKTVDYKTSDSSLDYFDTSANPDINPSILDLRLQRNWTGDWSTGGNTLVDGAHVWKSDEGFTDFSKDTPAYFDHDDWSLAAGFFSPIKQIPSAGLFGTLPSGVKKTQAAYIADNPDEAAPWRTLLFCPNPDAGKSHFGFQAPADYLLLDLFHMPVVEPYAISEPLSTAGRINMNSQLMPFTKIVRDTGLHAVLSSQKVTAIPPGLASTYKMSEGTATYRYRVNAEETLKQFHERYAPGGDAEAGDLFRSPSEICSVYLIPSGASSVPILSSSDITWEGTTLKVPKMDTWWQDYRLTGDNLRERPYALMYPLLTTKSNTYTVHMIAQSISVKKVDGSTPGAATYRTTVKGEYRGSATIERYIDPADERIGKAVIGESGPKIDPDTQSLEPLYRFRVVDTKRFAP